MKLKILYSLYESLIHYLMTSQLNSIHTISKGFRRLVASLSRRRHEINARPVRMGFFMVRVALEQDFLLELRFPPVSIFLPKKVFLTALLNNTLEKSNADCVLPNHKNRLP